MGELRGPARRAGGRLHRVCSAPYAARVIVDANNQDNGSRVATDVCIVGGGPAGIAMAVEFAGAGFRVLILEAGDRVQTRAAQRMGRGESVGQPYYRMDLSRIRAFGGSSNHWREWSGMRARPLDPLDFETRPEIGRTGWPFERAALVPFYRRAQQICNLGPFDYATPTWAEPGQAEALDLDPELAETVMFQVGPLGQFAARMPELLAADNITVMLHASVLEVVTDDMGTQATSVDVGARPGHRFHVDATVFVLATGGLENPRLMLASRHTHRSGVGNAHDLVGRYFMEHPHVNSGVVVPESGMPALELYSRRVTRGTHHIAMLKLTDELLRREGLLSTAWALLPASVDVTSPQGRALIGLKEIRAYRWMFPGTAARAKVLAADPRASLRLVAQAARLRRKPDSTVLKLSMMGEQAPNRESRVMLSDKRDRLGSPMTKLDWRLNDLDLHTIRRSQELLGQALTAAGLGHLEQRFGDGLVPTTVGGGYHHMGTTRMHASPREGVVDADGKVHGLSNLYVTGMSVFPTAGYANPTLTVVAVAVRLAAHIRSRLEKPINIRSSANGVTEAVAEKSG